MTDEDAAGLVPVVEEFVREVKGRDPDAVEACLAFTDPRTLAVLCADLLVGARVRVTELARIEAAYVRCRTELQELRERNAELRGYLYEGKVAA